MFNPPQIWEPTPQLWDNPISLKKCYQFYLSFLIHGTNNLFTNYFTVFIFSPLLKKFYLLSLLLGSHNLYIKLCAIFLSNRPLNFKKYRIYPWTFYFMCNDPKVWKCQIDLWTSNFMSNRSLTCLTFSLKFNESIRHQDWILRLMWHLTFNFVSHRFVNFKSCRIS